MDENYYHKNNFVRAITNYFRNPIQANVDNFLYGINLLGVPANATNYLRDLNVSMPYRLTSGLRGAIDALIHRKPFTDSYREALSNPTWFDRFFTIRPLTNTSRNYSKDELDLIYRMAGSKGAISNEDIKRESSNSKYGNAGGIMEYFTPEKTVQTANGQMSHDPYNYLQDMFDVNTKSEEAKHDNNMYINMALSDPGFNYQTVRATMPFTSSLDIMPDEFKIHTKIDKR